MNAFTAYHESAVATQTPGRIVVMLYDGAIKFLNKAIAAMEANDIAAKAQYIEKASAVIEELDASLNVEIGGEMAVNLRRLYEFCLRHITKAHLRNDPQQLREVINILQDLNEAWKAVTA
jgi:flagellar protein FliS